MKYGFALGLSFAILALVNTQEISSNKQADLPLIGLRVEQRAPAFASRDQFGHEQSSGTLRGSNGTVLLFFRSADW